MPDLTCCVGLPASGKSSWARRRQADDPTLTLVSRDDIRAMLHGSIYTQDNEKQVVAVERFIFADALDRGRSVICHDTALSPKVREELASLASHHGATFTIADFTPVPLAECIRRDAGRVGKERVGEDVIRRMAKLIPAQETP